MARIRTTHADFVQELYEAVFKPKKLAPAYVRQLKVVLLKESKKTKQNTTEVKKAGNAWLKEKGLGKKAPAKSTTTKTASAKKKPTAKRTTKKKAAKKPATKKKSSRAKAAVVDVPTDREGKVKIDVRKLSMKELRGTAKDLGVKVTKGMTEDALREAVADAMVGMTDDAMEVVNSVNYEKLDECIGLFIDLTSATCISCSLQSDCRRKFAEHQANGFAAFAKVRLDIKTDETADAVEAEDLPPKDKPKATKKPKKKKDAKFIAKRKINVYEIDIEDDDDAAEFLRDLLDTVPQTMGELRDLVVKHYEPDDGEDDDSLTLDIARQLVDIDAIELLK